MLSIGALATPTLGSMAALAACGDDGASVDAGVDAAHDSGADTDAALPLDAGPPPSGCDRVARIDAGVPTPIDDGGVIDPGAFPPARGPGGPRVAFTDAQLLVQCGSMSFGPTDEHHHNTGFFLDGYLVRPWAHEHGGGGIAVHEMDDPCNPVEIANVLDAQIRETHSTGLSTVGGTFIAVASLTGIEFWDLADITAPRMVHDMTLLREVLRARNGSDLHGVTSALSDAELDDLEAFLLALDDDAP